MINRINNLYSIIAKELTKLGENTWLIETNNHASYILHKITSEIEEIFPWDNIEDIVLTKEQTSIFIFENNRYYISNYYGELAAFDSIFFARELARFHKATLNYQEVTNAYFEKKIELYNKNVQYWYQYEIRQTKEIMCSRFFQPTSLFIIHSYIYSILVDRFFYQINKIKEEAKNVTMIRTAYNFNHFEKSCFDLKTKKLIGLGHIEKDIIIEDLQKWLYALPENFIIRDLREYLMVMPLEIIEKRILICSLYNRLERANHSSEKRNLEILIANESKLRMIYELEKLLGVDNLNEKL